LLKRDKERVVAELVERLRASDTLIVADYRGLTMSEIDGVRTELLKHGARFSVVKNTLTKRAAEEAGVPSLVELLDGPTAIAFVLGGDMVAVAKSLNDTARQTKVLTLKGGIVQGQAVSGEQVQKLAALPPTDVLQSQVLAAVVGPLTAIVGLFTAPLRELVGVIDARIEQLGGAVTAEPDEKPQPVEDEPPAPEAEAPREDASEAPEESGSDAETEASTEEANTAAAEGSAEESTEGEGKENGN
jgi:large subunit ribosomal protein L10